MALLLTVATGAWAQDPDPIDLTPSADGTVWTLSTMPEYDVELEVTYYTDEEIAAMEKIGYYLVGNMNGWTPDSKYKLTENPGAEGEYMITLYLDADDEFKIVYSADGTTATTWFPDGMDNNKKIVEGERYTVYFRPNFSGGDDWWYNCIYVASDPLYATPTGNKNEWAFEMPDYDVELEIEYETDLTLSEETDNTATLAAWDGCDAIVTMQRTLQAGSWNTLTLPYDIPAGSLGLTVKKLTGATLTDGTLNLTFEDANSLEAGKPYLVKVNSDLDFSTLAVANVTVEATPQPVTFTNVDFVPTLGKTLVTGPEGDESNEDAVLFLAADDKLVNPTVVNDPAQAASYIKGFRAFFRLKGDAVNAASFNLDMGNGETTSINSIDNGELRSENYDYYNLAGQKVDSSYKGIVIKKGKKIVVK
jgi:hypothetical protein